MEQIQFHNLEFKVEDGKLRLTRFGNLQGLDSRTVEVQIAGENKPSYMGVKLCRSSEGMRATYVSHTVTGNVLEILQETDLVYIRSIYTVYDDTNTVRCATVVENRSTEEIVLEDVSALYVSGFGADGVNGSETQYLTTFQQSHQHECQPIRQSFKERGLYHTHGRLQKKLSFANVGSWSTKEALPQAILEDLTAGTALMFQIESNNSWYYEISDEGKTSYLYLGGGNATHTAWSRALKPGASYRTPNVAVSFGTDTNEVIGEMTKYRRHIAGNAACDRHLPSIFNEYMHLSWDNPSEEKTRQYAPAVAAAGIEYYVIDCGWHNEEPAEKIYSYIGHWKESKTRFPHGIRATTDYIRSLGMKPGLWIEPETVGCLCEEMQSYYDDDCFLQRNGKRIKVVGRNLLDYRNEKVRSYMTESIRRMVEDYGAEYIKFDYNQDAGVGTDRDASSPGSGLEDAALAFYDWLCEVIARFPNVIFEGCAGGGMRMDYKMLSAFSLLSTSDQISYVLYPYIAGNILSAVLPEQAAVWSYPRKAPSALPNVTEKSRVTVNMVNSLLGRMHLASNIGELSEEGQALVKEGVEYYNSLSEIKKRALPYFPNGFTFFDEPSVVSGLRDGNRIYLAVWCLSDELTVRANIKNAQQVRIAYPTTGDAKLTISPEGIDVTFPEKYCAAFLEIDL